ncbi:MAG TPA: UbiX family flavin prenyltransferase [Nitrososphaerales archaeon]|nr:UbiX family flavin prenyltransferase [Nitrososphaerales archaeon]
MRLVVGISGGSGVIYGVRMLEALKRTGAETHLIMTQAAKETLVLETDYSVSHVEGLSSYNYRINDIAALPASGSYQTDGMIVIPCSMKSLAGIAVGYEDNLLIRAAAVTLKENRKLVLVPRETPLTTIHIENMLRVANAGAIVVPAMPGFYYRPKSVDDMIDYVVGKVLDILGVEHELYRRWSGPPGPRSRRR